MATHPNKHIREAIEYAERHGWIFAKAGPHAHRFGTIYCRHRARDGCSYHIYGTPRTPEAHAKDIRRAVDHCPHSQSGSEP